MISPFERTAIATHRAVKFYENSESNVCGKAYLKILEELLPSFPFHQSIELNDARQAATEGLSTEMGGDAIPTIFVNMDLSIRHP